jgi:hypothetical protein
MILQNGLINRNAPVLFHSWFRGIEFYKSDNLVGGSQPAFFPSRFQIGYFAPGRHLLQQPSIRGRRRTPCAPSVPAPLLGGE